MLHSLGFSFGVALGVAFLQRRLSHLDCDEEFQFLCTTGACPICSRWRGQYSIETVQVSIVCAQCTMEYFQTQDPYDEHLYTVSEFEAIKKSGCRPNDLVHLPHSHFFNSSESVIERRYLRSDVWYLRNFRRKEKLERAIGYEIREVHPLVRHFMLGDYIDRLSDSETDLRDVLRYKNVVHRATEIIRHCPKAHPAAALDFCLLHSKSGPEEFRELKEKMHKVFRLEGRRILHGLTKDERMKLKGGPLNDVFEAFHATDSKKLIRSYLSKWFDETSVDVIMTDDCWKHQEFPEGPEDRAAVHLRDCWREKLKRKEKLTKALSARGLSMPESCFDCDGYVDGFNILSLGEIVTVVELRNRLTLLGCTDGELAWCIGFDRLFRCLKKRRMGRSKAVQHAVRAALLSRKRRTET